MTKLTIIQSLSFQNVDSDLNLCREVIRDNLGDSKLQSITFIQILNYVSKQHEINTRKLIGKNRSHEIAEARQIIMFLTRKLTNLSLKHIGKELGGRDHSTVIHSCNLIASKMKKDPAFNRQVEKYILDLNRFGNAGE